MAGGGRTGHSCYNARMNRNRNGHVLFVVSAYCKARDVTILTLAMNCVVTISPKYLCER